MDHPPIIQCQKCWKFGHYAANCKSTTKCRICHGDHEESQHIQACTKCTNETNMVIDGNNSCMHTNPSCINCKTEGIDDCAHPSNWTRCPICLRKLGEAHEQPRHIVKGRMAKRPTTQKTTTQPTQQGNRYATLEIATLSIDIVTSEARTLGIKDINLEKTWQTMAEITNTLCQWLDNPAMTSLQNQLQ